MSVGMARPGAGTNGTTTATAASSSVATRPSSLRDALRAVNKQIDGSGSPLDSTSDEDYDHQDATATLLLRRRPTIAASGPKEQQGSQTVTFLTSSENGKKALLKGLRDLPSHGTDMPPVLAVDTKELRDVLRKGLQLARDSGDGTKKRRGKFSDLVFTKQFSTFDRHHEHAANSPFHGFYTLFWLGIALFMLKIAAENWRTTGSPLGTNEIMQNMFRRDLVVLLAADGVMCGVTGMSWVLQRLIFQGCVDWNRSGWIIQNLWQTAFIGGVIGLTLWRDWPWTHTVYFVLHGIVMLMKQHSYAFYNGYLSTIYKERVSLFQLLRKLEDISPAASPSATAPPLSSLSTDHLAHPPSAAQMKERRHSMSIGAGPDGTDLERITSAVEAGEGLDLDQCHAFERIIKWEIDALSDELQGKALSKQRAYPHNLTFTNHYEYIVLPTVVYELEYPRSETISWPYVAEKSVAMVGLILVMIMLSQALIYPIVMKTVAMKEAGMPLAQRFREFPWILSDLIFPFMMEYLLAWYLIWETVLNILAELTYFADRSFYDAWWNSVSWDQFARDWNRPVHNFLLRHVYHSSISSMKVNKVQATLITFFLSACVHELVMWCLFKKLRGYLLFLQMCQLPLVSLSRSRWLRGRKTLGNLIFWLGIFTGPSLLCSLYLVL